MRDWVTTEGKQGDAYTQVVSVTIEDRIISNLVRGEGRSDIQLTVLDEKIIL